MQAASTRHRLRVAPVFIGKRAPMVLQSANPVGIEDDAVDLAHHVQRVVLPSPGTHVSRAQPENADPPADHG